MSSNFYWYKLLHVRGIGISGVNLIFNIMKKNSISIENIFELDENDFYYYFPILKTGKFSKFNFINLKELDENYIFNSFNKLIYDKVELITLDDEMYPKLLKERLKNNAPPVLFCKGYLPLLQAKNVAIVGSRNVDSLILDYVKKISKVLANEGYNIVSGYAKGVDTNAHLGALEINGTTSIILSMGLNQFKIKKELQNHDIEHNVLFISQFMPNEKWSGRNAMARNKVVCSISDAVIVIASGPEKDSEGKMSGTFEAGKTAIKLKIPLFVLSPTKLNSNFVGNKKLIDLGGKEFFNEVELLDQINNLNKFKTKTKKSEQLSLF